MSHVTPYEYDIFISYAHMDDSPLTEGDNGWVSAFHRSLVTFIEQILGERPAVFRDPKLQGNEYFNDSLLQALPNTALLVSILSPRYLKSEWCLKELESFAKGAERLGSVRIDDKSRIFKVVKTLVGREAQPPPLNELLGYEFFQLDQTTGRPEEFRVEFGPEAKQHYFAKVYETAYEICELLKQMSSAKEGDTEQPPATGKTVFLAETTSDRVGDRDAVKGELRQLGYTVLPDQQLPVNAEALEDAVRAYLDRSELAIHLIGEIHGFSPEGDKRSAVRLQLDSAARYCEDHDIKRVVWLPPGLSSDDDRQQRLIDYLRNDLTAQENAELLETNLEELKTVIRHRLTVKPKAASSEATPSEASLIYLVCDQQDFEATAALADYLFSEGFDVLFPAFEGDESEVRADHTDKLVTCDAVLIYFGEASDLWLSSKIRDLRKLPGFDGYKPKAATAIYATSPATPQKERLQSREALIIKSFEGFSPDALVPFVTAIKEGAISE